MSITMLIAEYPLEETVTTLLILVQAAGHQCRCCTAKGFRQTEHSTVGRGTCRDEEHEQKTQGTGE